MKHAFLIIILLGLMHLVAKPVDDTDIPPIEIVADPFTKIKDSRIDTVEEHREFQGIWASVDEQEMIGYYRELAIKYPQNPEYQYLYLRIQDSDVCLAQLPSLIKQNPDFYWYYRLLAICSLEVCKQDSLSFDADDPDTLILKQLKEGLLRFPEDSHLNLALFYLLKDSAEHQEISKYLLGLHDTEIITIHWLNITDYLAQEADTELHDILYDRLLEESVRREHLDPRQEREYRQRAHDIFLRRIIDGEEEQ